MASNLDNSRKGIINPDRSEWALSFWRIHSENSEVNEGLMQVLEGNVTCTGSSDVAETQFKLYNGGENGTDTIFECVGGSSKGMVLCIDSNHCLTAKQKSKHYKSFKDAEEDVLFYFDIPNPENPGQYQFKWKKDNTCIAFTKDGQPIPLDDPHTSIQETLFRGISLDNC